MKKIFKKIKGAQLKTGKLIFGMNTATESFFEKMLINKGKNADINPINTSIIRKNIYAIQKYTYI